MTRPTLGDGNAISGALGELPVGRVTRVKSWPVSPRALSEWLRPFLREKDIDISFEREGRARTRAIVITTTNDPAPENGGARPSAPSASPASTAKLNANNRFTSAPLRTVAADADGRARGTDPTVRTNPLKSNGGNGADGADANRLPQSAQEKAGWRARL